MLELDEPKNFKDSAKKKLEIFMSDISKSKRDLFSYREVEDMFLDIYNCLLNDINQDS